MDRWINKLVLGDCVEGMRLLPPESIPLIVTSPPYDCVRVYGGHPFDFEAVANELYRLTEEGGVVCWQIGEQINNGSQSGTSSMQRLYFRDLGFSLHDRLFIEQGTGCRNQRPTGYSAVIQEVFILSKGRPRHVQLIRDRKNATAGAPVKPQDREAAGGGVGRGRPGRCCPGRGRPKGS